MDKKVVKLPLFFLLFCEMITLVLLCVFFRMVFDDYKVNHSIALSIFSSLLVVYSLSCMLYKELIIDKDGLFLSFPFRLANRRIHFDYEDIEKIVYFLPMKGSSSLIFTLYSKKRFYFFKSKKFSIDAPPKVDDILKIFKEKGVDVLQDC